MKKNILGLSVLSIIVLASCQKGKLLDNFFDEVSTEECQLNLSESDFEVNTIEPLSSSGTDYYTDGRLEYVKNNELLAIVDFGDGANDSQALTTVNGTNTSIELKKESSKYKGKKSKYKKVIVEPLVKTDGCDFIVSGIIKYYELKSGDWVATIDFGDGTCDEWATKTWDVDVFPDYPSGTNDFSVFDYKDKK